MRNRIYAAIAGFATVAALAMTGFGTASAATTVLKPHATTVCGSKCWDVSNAFLGDGMVQNASRGAILGTQVNMRAASDSFTREDFIPDFQGIVGNTSIPHSACAVGDLPASSELCQNPAYTFDAVWQMEFAPDSNKQFMCVGTTPGTATFATERVRLETCGSESTFWVADNQYNDGLGDTPWINGADTNVTNGNALVLGVVNTPRGWTLNLQQENPSGLQVNDHKQFDVDPGPAV